MWSGAASHAYDLSSTGRLSPHQDPQKLLSHRSKDTWPHIVVMSFLDSRPSLQERSKDVSCPAVSSKTAMSRSGQTIAQQSPFHINLLKQEIYSRGEEHNSA